MSFVDRNSFPNRPGSSGTSSEYDRSLKPPTGSGHGSSGATLACGVAYESAFGQRATRSGVSEVKMRISRPLPTTEIVLSPGGTIVRV